MRKILAAVLLCALLGFLGTSPAHAAQAPTTVPATGWSVANLAGSYVGYPYAEVGDTPATGFSCTGFVAWIYRQYGYWLPEDVGILAVSYPYVAPENIQAGDILIFSDTLWPGYSHAAIYIGGGWMIGADNFSVGVHRDYLFDGYWYSHWTRSVRVLPY